MSVEDVDGVAPQGDQAQAAEDAAPSGLAVLPADAEAANRVLRRERDELQDQLLRRRAEFDNYRKRVERERAQVAADAEAALLKELIPTLLDNLERALESANPDDPMHAGVALIQRDLLALLARIGVSVHDPLGAAFDPELQEAVAHEEVPGVPSGQIVEVFRKGYVYKDRLLRPAWVKVAKGDPKSSDRTDSEGEEAVN